VAERGHQLAGGQGALQASGIAGSILGAVIAILVYTRVIRKG